MSAPAWACATASFGEERQRRVVVDLEPLAGAAGPRRLEDAAVAVVRVLAHAHVGHHDQPGDRLLERADRLRDDAVLVVGAAADRVLGCRDAEQDDGADARVVAGLRLGDEARPPRAGTRPAWTSPGSARAARGRTNSGQMRSSGARVVSRTRLRSASLRRMRRGRSWGKGMAWFLSHPAGSGQSRSAAGEPLGPLTGVHLAHHEAALEPRVEERASAASSRPRRPGLDLPHGRGVQQESELVLAGEDAVHRLAGVADVGEVLLVLLRPGERPSRCWNTIGVEHRHVERAQGLVRGQLGRRRGPRRRAASRRAAGPPRRP